MDEQKAEKFRRQKRKLMLISFFIIFYKAAGIAPEKINIFGNTADVKNPEALVFGIGVLLFYFLWRYFISISETVGFSSFRDGYITLRERISWKHAQKKFLKKLGNTKKAFNLYSDTEKKYIFGYFYKVIFRLMDISGDLDKESKDKIRDWAKNKKIYLGGFEFFLLKIWVITRYLLQDYRFSEVILPFILAAFAAFEYFEIFSVIEWVTKIQTL